MSRHFVSQGRSVTLGRAGKWRGVGWVENPGRGWGKDSMEGGGRWGWVGNRFQGGRWG